MLSKQKTPVRIGMVGGGPGGGIGETHRIAMRMDNKCDLVAGAFSREYAKSVAIAEELRIAPERIYRNYKEMADAESAREDKTELVCIVTPTDSHFQIVKTFLEKGFHVVCDKPLCVSLDEARQLEVLANQGGLILCLTHNYAGYAMVRQAAKMIRAGNLGEIKVVHVEHASGWAAKLQEDEKQKRPSWRLEAGSAETSLLLDLGTHAHHLARFITGLEVTEVAGELNRIVPDRAINDSGQAMLHFENGARGSIWISMAAVGNEQGIRIRVYGDKGSLEWFHEDPFHLRFSSINGPTQILAQGTEWVSPEAQQWTRGGLGHPEGYFEAFANLYTELADTIRERTTGDRSFLPLAKDGVKGLAFVEAFLQSHRLGGLWCPVATG